MYEITTSTALNELLFKLLNKRRYEFIYVSLGSKKNENTVTFRYPTRGLIKDCNSEYQMVPNFIRKKALNNNVLIIVIDDFHMVDLIKINLSILDNIEKQYRKIKTIIVDHIITFKSIYDYIGTIMDCVSYHKLDNNHFMLANFICFKQPNLLQSDFEKKLPDIIQKFLDSSYTYYHNCLYQWYSYAYYTYNYTYCYKQYNVHRLMSIQQLQTYMNKSFFDSYLDTNNQNIVSIYIKQFYKESDTKWEKFLENSICLHI